MHSAKSKNRPLVRAIVATGFLSILAACDERLVTLIPLDGGGGAGGDETPDAGPDAANASGRPSIGDGNSACAAACAGECVAERPDYFARPRLVWFGPDESKAPPCPPEAPDHRFTWHAEPQIPAAACGACTCGPSKGFCELPSTIITHAAPCGQAAGAQAMLTNPPANWSGACTTENPIPAGTSCNGAACVQSVSVGPLKITDEACAAYGTTPTPIEPATWKQTAKVCEGQALGACPLGKECAPARADGFRQCVEQPGIHDCPADGYTERFVVFEGMDDSRHCSPCTCGQPSGSSCAATISLYADATCTGQPSTVTASSNGPSCGDMIPPLGTVGAKAATAPVYHPGTCEAHGGELEGAAVPSGPRTLCCLSDS